MDHAGTWHWLIDPTRSGDLCTYDAGIANRACRGSDTVFHLHYDYIRQLLQNYRGLPILSYSHLDTVDHFPDASGTQANDPHLHALLADPLGFNHSTDFVIIMGDHGWEFGPFFRTPFGFMEHKLPMMHILAPQSQLSVEEADSLVINEQRLVSIHDLGVTLRQFIPEDPTGIAKNVLGSASAMHYGRSLLMPIPSSRSCLDAGVPQHLCTLNGPPALLDMPPEMSARLVSQLLSSLNQLIADDIDRGICLRLPSTTNWMIATARVASEFSEVATAVQLTITAKRDPSNGRCSDRLAFASLFELDRSSQPIPSSLIRVSQYSHEKCRAQRPQFCVCADTNRFTDESLGISLPEMSDHSSPKHMHMDSGVQFRRFEPESSVEFKEALRTLMLPAGVYQRDPSVENLSALVERYAFAATVRIQSASAGVEQLIICSFSHPFDGANSTMMVHIDVPMMHQSDVPTSNCGCQLVRVLGANPSSTITVSKDGRILPVGHTREIGDLSAALSSLLAGNHMGEPAVLEPLLQAYTTNNTAHMPRLLLLHAFCVLQAWPSAAYVLRSLLDRPPLRGWVDGKREQFMALPQTCARPSDQGPAELKKETQARSPPGALMLPEVISSAFISPAGRISDLQVASDPSQPLDTYSVLYTNVCLVWSSIVQDHVVHFYGKQNQQKQRRTVFQAWGSPRFANFTEYWRVHYQPEMMPMGLPLLKGRTLWYEAQGGMTGHDSQYPFKLPKDRQHFAKKIDRIFWLPDSSKTDSLLHEATQFNIDMLRLSFASDGYG